MNGPVKPKMTTPWLAVLYKEQTVPLFAGIGSHESKLPEDSTGFPKHCLYFVIANYCLEKIARERFLCG